MLRETNFNLNNIITNINDHIDKCKDKIKHHTKNSQACEQWSNALSVLGLILSAGLALSLTILTINQRQNFEITITGAIFAFFITINQRVSNAFNFPYLQAKHHNAMDDFIELQYLFNNLITDVERQEFDIKEYDTIINRYVAISQKNHIPNIKSCVFCCICFRH